MKWVERVHQVYPGATIWHNDSKVIEGTTNVEDAMLYYTQEGHNYGGGVIFSVTTSTLYPIIRVKNVAAELGVGATISACVCSLYNYQNNGESNISAYSIFKPWVEGDDNGVDNDDGDVTWDDWASDDYEWTTAGCACADDAGVDNDIDGGGCYDAAADRKATAEDTENITAADTWYAWNMSSTLAQAWYDETKNEEGILLVSDVSDTDRFYSTESAEDEKPFWTFTYTSGAPAAGRRERVIELLGRKR